MKYVVLIYSNPATWETLPASERDRVLGIHNSIIKELTETGELLRVDGLAHPTNTKTVRLQGGRPIVTDGPFSEAKEQLAGVWALDVRASIAPSRSAPQLPNTTRWRSGRSWTSPAWRCELAHGR